MVVVAMAIVAVLAVTVLWIALMNLQMKVTDEKNTDNFYSAEGVLDQICTGLQGDISKAYSAGYTKVMENYSDSSINEAGRQSNFAQEYLKSLKTSLEYDSTGMTFNMGKLIQYVDPKLLEKKDNQPRAIIKSTNADVNGNGQLKVYQNRVVLNGLRVEYTDEKGFKSIIETDISLGVPSMSFTASGGVPELFTYSLVGNEGLEITSGPNNKVNLSGNLYAGCKNAAGTGTSTTSVTIPNNATLDVKDTSYMIAEGDIEVGDFAGKDTATIKKNMAGVSNNSTLSVDSQCQLWTSNINVNGAKVNLDGMTYVADDMTLKGTGSKVTLGKNNKNNNAKYVGFGNGGADKENPVAGDSSAIIINGREASLDMSNIRELMLAGTAYINTQAIVNSSGVGTENSNVPMGESISVKGDQIAYLVPPECIGTSGDGADAKSLYNKNPLSYKEYKDITATGQDQPRYTEINANVVSIKTGKALSAYLPESKTIDNCIKKVFVPSTDDNGGLVYYYVNLPTNKAAEYYRDYFGADSDKLNRYTKFYTDSIQVNEAASIYTAGNYSIYDGNNLSLLKGIADGVDMDAQSDALQRTYTALNSKLLTNYSDLPTNAESVSLFTNIVNNTNLQKIVQNSGNKHIFETEYQGKKYQAIVINGDYTYGEKDKSHNVDIIVATGDVTLNDDFTGTIVAKGRIIVNKKQCEIDNGTQELFKALLLEKVSDADDALHLYDVFMDGANYLGNVSSFSNKKEADTKIDYATLITYQNWTKE